ncbi:MFS transporter [Sulfolobus sp. E5-1-F]|uniref:MFS transporter n=1 Tax=Saccharolobus sp. E5-1-F TaxID=2663019 RepID=UPI001295B507|nr:MFS transporter [Sulfolobus sp. E5-1-F]QGA55406.1 MFS transporter [Sulfolobus sp. E5-1-F]
MVSEKTKAIVASSFGMALEWYDFFIYTFVATVVSKLFFPSSNPITSLLAFYLTFFIGFLGRPLGGLVFGYIGDKLGRKSSLVFTILLTGLSVFFVGLLPTYYQIGILAPILLAILRFLTGVALGGEWGGAFSLTSEYVNPNRRGLYSGILQATVSIANLLATGIIFVIIAIMGQTGFDNFGWRILFYTGLFIAIIGLIIRLRIEDSPVFRKLREERKVVRNPITEAFRNYWKLIVANLFIVGVINGAWYYTNFAYSISYATTIAQRFNMPHLSLQVINFAILIVSVVGIFASIFFGYLSDLIGRRTQIIINAIIGIVLAYPYYYLLLQGNELAAISAIILGGLLIYYFSGAITPAFLVESYPPTVRYTAISFTYQIGVGFIGGLTPFILTYLVGVTNNIFSPVYFTIATGLIVLILALSLKETKGKIYEGEEILKQEY